MKQRFLRKALIHAPPGSEIVRDERMSPAFVKYHLDDGRVLHRFTRPEPNASPHDHPWPFRTQILAGGYVEEVFKAHSDGSWSSALERRVPGVTYEIMAEHIHRIVALPEGECWTLVEFGRHERKTHFWRFGAVIQKRAWNTRKWIVHWPARGGR